MKALNFYIREMASLEQSYRTGKVTVQQYIDLGIHFIKVSSKMAEQELKDAYKHGSDDENCRLSDGAMAPDYENADEWYQGEYGGEAWNYLQ